jgi:hypothetical protein
MTLKIPHVYTSQSFSPPMILPDGLQCLVDIGRSSKWDATIE